MKKHIALLISLIVASVDCHSQTPLNPAYTAIDLGTLGGSSSGAYGINNSGVIVGFSASEGSNLRHATRFDPDGTRTDLGTLGGTESFAHAINDFGQAAGQSWIAGNSATHATRFNTDGTLSDLGTLGGANSAAYSINNSGDIVGYAQNASNVSLSTRFNSNGSRTDLGTLGGTYSGAYGINNARQIVGMSSLPGNGANTATLFGSSGQLSDLGTLGGSTGTANAINENSQIVGYSAVTGDGAIRATLFNPAGSLVDLGTLGGTNSVAYSINASGQIVGFSAITGNSGQHGFLYSGGAMSDLNDLILSGSNITNFTMTNVGNHINDWGQIVGEGLISDESHAILLNPVTPLTSDFGEGAGSNTKFVGGMDYDKFIAKSNFGGFGTTVDLLEGTAGSSGWISYEQGGYGLNRDVTMTFSDADDPRLTSDIVSVEGTFSDWIVLSLTYSETLYGDNVFLGWFDEDSQEWKLAVDGNTGGMPTFIEGAYNSSFFELGYYGRDSESNTVWAVINHNSEFGAVPEPTTWMLLAIGMAAFGLNRWSKRLGTN